MTTRRAEIDVPSIPAGMTGRETVLQLQVVTNAPWMKHLSPEQQRMFFLEAAAEMLDAARTKRKADVVAFIRGWKEVAECLASKELRSQLMIAEMEDEAGVEPDWVGIDELREACQA